MRSVPEPTWRQAWADRRLRVELLAAPLLLVGTLHALAGFLVWVEGRPGAHLDDPVLAHLPPADSTWLVFGLLYASIGLPVLEVARHPRALAVGVEAYVLMILARMVVMYVTPLEPPGDMIVLRDPFTESLGTARVLTRDLFFSGHTSTVFLMCLVARHRWLKPALALCTLGVAVGVLRQHVHYTVDVVVAPLFAFGALRAVEAMHSRQQPSAQTSENELPRRSAVADASNT